MNARFYLPGVGRFLSADTVVPDPTNPQQFNRYTYSHNNPIRFTDPTGHCAENPSSGDAFDNDYACWELYHQAANKLGNGFGFLGQWTTQQLQRLLFWLGQGVYFQNTSSGNWASANLTEAVTALDAVHTALGGIDSVTRALGLGQSGGLFMQICRDCDPSDTNHDYTNVDNTIRFDDATPITLLEIVHELGHAVDWNIGNGRDWWSNKGLDGLGWTKHRCWLILMCGPLTQDGAYGDFPNENSFKSSPQEDFADTFAAYVFAKVKLPYPEGWNSLQPDREDALTTALTP